jgi:pimeloyl-ACP methyl ester carboxylesterase
MSGDGPAVTQRRVDVGEVALMVTEAGEGELVILLHGFPELAYSWRHQIPALAAAGFHAAAPDLRGYGGSDRPSEVAAYALPRLLEDALGLMRALGHERAHFVGHDWGGSVAWVAAARASEAVFSLTILNSPHPVASAEARQDPEQRQKSWYMLLFQFEGVAEEWFSTDDFANAREFVFDTAAPGTFSEADRGHFLEALSQPGALTAAMNYYRANIPPATWLRPPPDLPPITVPTLIIWGEGDAYLSPLILDRSAAKVQGPLAVERLPGVSHWVQQEAPDAVNERLIAFLEEQRGR